MSLKELVEEHNAAYPGIAFDGFAVLVNGTALSSPEAREKIIQDNDNIRFIEIFEGG